MDRQTDDNSIIKFKRTRGYIPLFFMLSVVLLGLSIYCIIYAYTEKLAGVSATIFYIAGIIGTLFFAYSAFDNLFQTIQPKNALIVGNDGFADFTIGGVGIGAVEWDNVKSVRTERSKDGRLLVIELNDLASLLENAPKPVQKAVLNSDYGDNTIALRQMDIEERLVKIESIFKQHMSESKKRAEQKIAEDDNSKTKVITDRDVNKLIMAMSEHEPNEKGASNAEPANDNDAVRINEVNENSDAVSEDNATDDIVLPQDEDIAEEPQEKAVSFEEVTIEPDVQDKSEATETANEKNVNTDALKHEGKEDKKDTPDNLEELDALFEGLKPRIKKEKSDLDELLSKFGDELKSGKTSLSDNERDKLTDELNAMLEDIRKKKNSKK